MKVEMLSKEGQKQFISRGEVAYNEIVVSVVERWGFPDRASTCQAPQP